MGKNRSNIDSDKIPWDALRTLISQSVFGGKIDNEFDNKILLSLVEKFFRQEAYNIGFELFDRPVGTEEEVLKVPEGMKSHKDYLAWIKKIEMIETPAWSGLPNNVEKIVRQRQAVKLISNIKAIQGTGDDLNAGDQGDKQSWISELQVRLEKMLALLPGQLELLIRTAQAITNPLFRFLEREVTVASTLLNLVRVDINMLLEFCRGARKSTNVLKALAEDLYLDKIPKRWMKYTVANIGVTAWINDFVKRVD